jgi:Holliday junction resolvase RusA-like endonuclease
VTDIPSMADPPFGCPPPVFAALDLPMPPSANNLWRKARGRMILSPEYQAWKRQADGYALGQKPRGGFPTIDGPFEAKITLDRDMHGRGDIDNRVKALGDFLQHLGIVSNDKNMQRLEVSFGYAPIGCRVVVRSMGEAA